MSEQLPLLSGLSEAPARRSAFDLGISFEPSPHGPLPYHPPMWRDPNLEPLEFIQFPRRMVKGKVEVIKNQCCLCLGVDVPSHLYYIAEGSWEKVRQAVFERRGWWVTGWVCGRCAREELRPEPRM